MTLLARRCSTNDFPCRWAASVKLNSVTEMMKTFSDIERAKERVQDGRFFVMLKLTEEETGRHVLLVECVKSTSCRKRRYRWLEKDFVRQKPKQSKMLHLKPSQEFCIKLEVRQREWTHGRTNENAKRHAKMGLRTYADNEVSDQSVHSCSLVQELFCLLIS